MMAMKWVVETLNEVVDRELEALPLDMRARFIRVSNLIETFGLDQVGYPHIRHLEGTIWEIGYFEGALCNSKRLPCGGGPGLY